MDSTSKPSEQNDNDYNMRRHEAARYLTEQGRPTAKSSLDVYAVRGDGPPYRKFGRFPLYSRAGCREWAAARMSKVVHSTSELAA